MKTRHDGEDTTVHSDARQYSPIQGRWLTPDPAGLAAVDPSNPQTWNRYAYVTNNPVSFTDPKGLYIVDCVWNGCGPSGGPGGGDAGAGGGGYGGDTPSPGVSFGGPLWARRRSGKHSTTRKLGRPLPKPMLWLPPTETRQRLRVLQKAYNPHSQEAL